MSSRQSWDETLGSWLRGQCGSLHLQCSPNPLLLARPHPPLDSCPEREKNIELFLQVCGAPIVECPLHPDCCQGPEVHRIVFLQVRRMDSVLWGHSPCPQPPTERRNKRRLGPGAPMAHSWARAPTCCGLVGAPGSLTQGGTFSPAWESNSHPPPRRSLGKLPALGSSDNRYDLLSTYCTCDASLHQPISVFAPHPARSAFWLRKLGKKTDSKTLPRG